MHHAVTIIKWKYTDLPNYLQEHQDLVKIINVNDVHDYVNAVLEKEYDAYVLGAAVANLIPKNPWDGKFPSHNYKVGDIIPIEFEIAPRVIDEVKKKYPRSLLIGYKLFDGTEDELISAGWHTLTDSKANAVFCNHPKWAQEKKLVLLPDGTRMKIEFNEQSVLIDRMLKLKWYKTEINAIKESIPAELKAQLEEKLFWVTRNADPALKKFSNYDFGTVAIRYKDGFFTTTRGKRDSGFTFVSRVDHKKRIVHADEKATLNSPLISKLFENSKQEFDMVIHAHSMLNGSTNFPYLFPGTTEENKAEEENAFNIEGHGHYALVISKRPA